MDKLSHWITNHLQSLGVQEIWAKYLNMIILVLALLVVVFIIDFVFRKVLLKAFSKFTSSSKTHFDDFLIKNKTPRNLAHILPILLVYWAIPYILVDFEYAKNIALKGIEVFGIILCLWIVRSLLNTFKDFFKTLPNLRDKPIDSYIQVFMIFAWAVGILYAFSIITGAALWQFLTALGTASAVIILVFRDTILGFVASIQVSINDMVRIGDWITFEKYGADGDVVEINLATVKVQNFDKTITTIPTYALISDSFKNWRGMTSSPGRRIKRAVIIKQESIRFLSNDDVENFKKIDLIKDYLNTRQKDIFDYNQENNIDKSILINGRNLTNLGVFRKYIDVYLNNHSAINKEMMIMARQLAPTTQGIAIEIYAFSNDKRWENYEYIIADIFDHMLAATPYFDLEIFELGDVRNVKTP